MNEPGVAYLTNSFNLHHSWGTWERFIASCDLIDEREGYKWYRRTNCHYFVCPDGRILHHVYGYHGKNFWASLLFEHLAIDIMAMDVWAKLASL